jgi:hypothetical protein
MDRDQTSVDATKEIDEKIIDQHNSIPEEIKEEVFERDNYRCQTRGCKGCQRGGTAQLLVQLLDGQVEDNVEAEDCTTICLHCARWIAKMPTTADLRPQLKQNLNGVDINPNWAEILNYLDSNGPATTSEIFENITLNSKQGTRHALYGLMSLDIRKEEIDDRIIVKDRIHRTYGLPQQVPNDHDARGVIPIQPSERRSRILDEIARRLDNEISEEVDDASEIIAGIVDRKPEQIHKLKRRAEAFDYPFEAWAANKYPKQDRATVIDAVSALANCTDNVSRQLLSSVIADVFKRNDEEDLADLLNNWAHSNEEYKKHSSRPKQSTKNQPSPLEAEEETNKQSQQTLDGEINRNDSTAQRSSNSDDSDGHNLSPLSLVESKADADTSEEDSNNGLN